MVLTTQKGSISLKGKFSERRVKYYLKQHFISQIRKTPHLAQERSRVRMQTCIPRPPM